MECTLMATLARTSDVSVSGYPAHSLRYNWLMVGLCALFIFGLYLDGWAHNNGQVDDTFFTPWHAVLYSSYALVGLALVVTQFRNVSRGHSFFQALPRGYGLALVGVVLFGFGGGFDFIWHSVFGFEANLEALLSPAHLLLASGAFLFLTAPLRATWYRKESSDWREVAPAVVAMALLFAFFSFFMQYAHFLYEPIELMQRRFANSNDLQIMRFFGIFTQMGLLMGLVLFGLRRWKTLPFGTITLMMAANVALYFWMVSGSTKEYPLVSVAPVLGGLIADVLLRVMRPSSERPEVLRLFAFLAPLVIILVFFGGVQVAGGLAWAIHLWLGASVLAGVVGLFLSYLVFPPAIEPV
jgi:hypothetical protein